MSETREFWTLLKLHLRMRLGLSTLRASARTTKGKAKIAGFILIGIYVLAALWGTLSLVLYPLMEQAMLRGLQDMVFGVVILACMLLTLVLGTLSLLGLVFNAKDTELYASMPIRQGSVFGAKFSMVYLTELAFSVFMMLPCAVIYALHGGGGFLFWLKLPVIIILIPVVPLVVSSLLAFPMMLIISRTRRRDGIMIVLSLLLLIGVMVGQMALSMSMTSIVQNPDELVRLLSSQDGPIQLVLGAFPPAMWAARALLQSGAGAIGGFLLLLLACMLSLGLAIFISSKVYYKGALAQLESAKKGKAKAYQADRVKLGSPLKAFFFKELRIIRRTPVYAMNQFAMPIILPLMIFMMRSMSGMDEDLDQLSTLLTDPSLPALPFALIIAGIFCFFALINPAASTTFTREGGTLYYLKALPVSVPVQLAGRLVFAAIVPLVTVALSSALLAFLFPLPPLILVSAILVAVSAVPLVTAAAMIPDAAKPKLRWNSEAEAMKQNFNSVLGMLAGLLSLVPAVLMAVLLGFLDVSLPLVTVALVILNAGLFVGVLLLLNKTAERMMERLQ